MSIERLIRAEEGAAAKRAGPRPILLLLALATLLGPAAASAQTFGRWWWDGALAVGQRSNENLRDSERAGGFDQRELRLGLGLNGFLGHPSIGDFRLGLSTWFSRFQKGASLDSDRLGGELRLNLLPGSRTPAGLYLRRDNLGYSATGADDPRVFGALADTTDQAGAWLRLARGPLRGTYFGLDYSTIDYLNPRARQEVWNRQLIDWSRSSLRFNHNLKLERRDRIYGTTDLETEDYIANFSELARFTDTWRWELNGFAVQRNVVSSDVATVTDDLQARTRLSHDVRGRDLLEVVYTFDFSGRQEQDSLVSHLGSATYWWRFRPGWQLAPFLLYGYQGLDGRSLRSPRAGLALYRHWTGRRLDGGFNVRGSYGQVEGRIEDVSRSDSQGAYSFAGSLGHGRDGGLRKEVEAEWGRNELRFRRTAPVLPGVIAPAVAGLGTEEFARARLTMSHRWRQLSFSGWGEWQSRQADGGFNLRDFEADILRAVLQVTGRSLGLQAEIGESDTLERRQASPPDLEPFDSFETLQRKTRYITGLARWRPVRRLYLQALYRVDDQLGLELLPDVQSERLDLSIQYRLGAFVLEVRAWEQSQQVEAGFDTSLRGYSWTLSRRFAGWLPFVTGDTRRGVVR